MSDYEIGTCPICGSSDLEYGAMKRGTVGNEIYYPFTCLDCGFEGREWYILTFVRVTDNEGNNIDMEDEGVKET